MDSSTDTIETLAHLKTLQTQHPLSVLKLAEPLLPSSTSAGPDQSPTPASLSQDLSHYRSLFAKLRLSYTTQVTKEKFLRNLIAAPRPDPATLSTATNAELERECAALKRELKGMKGEVDALVKELEGRARELGARWARVQEGMGVCEDAGKEVEMLRVQCEGFRAEIESRMGGLDAGEGEMGLGLEGTVALVEEKEEKLEAVERELEMLAQARVEKERELKRMKGELDAAEGAKNAAVIGAEEARRRRVEGKGGLDDEIEERGRWLRGAEATLRKLLMIEE